MNIELGALNWILKNRSIGDITSRVLSLIYGYPLLLISFFFSRNKTIWVFGYKVGFADNAKYLYRYVAKNESDVINPIWIAATIQESKKLRLNGIIAYYRWSLLGVYYCLRAKFYIYSSHLSDINYWTSGNCVGVNLWHGIGIKNIEFKTTSGPDAKIYNPKNILNRVLFPHLFRKPDFFISTSKLMSKHFSDCFRIPLYRCLNVGYPRCDLFFENVTQIESDVQKCENIDFHDLIKKLKTFQKVVVYMPTFRDSQIDFLGLSGINMDKLEDCLRLINGLFIFKLHPATRLKRDEEKHYNNILFLDKDIDIYPLLPFTNILVTDYSSIYYDYLLLKKKILLFPFDYDEYIRDCRDLAFDFNEYTPGVRVNSFDELLNNLIHSNDELLLSENQERIAKLFWGNYHGDACLQIVKHLRNLS